MAEFKVSGPFEVPWEKQKGGGRKIVKDGFWETSAALEELKTKFGVYVFAIKPPRTKAFTPFYVGQAKKGFGAEVFTNDKLYKYSNALGRFRKGAPYLFFLVHPSSKKNEKHIGQLEDYFITMGFAVNENIENDKGTKPPGWALTGVIRGSARKPSAAAKHIAKMFEIKSRKGV